MKEAIEKANDSAYKYFNEKILSDDIKKRRSLNSELYKNESFLNAFYRSENY